MQDKGVAQGGLIDTPHGDWYAYLFQDHGAVGRIPYLVPVKWEDGWPVLGDRWQSARVRLNLPASNGPIPGIVASDEFDRRPGEPSFRWSGSGTTIRITNFGHSRSGQVSYGSSPDGLTRIFYPPETHSPSGPIGPECSGTTAVDVANMKDGDFAGLALLQKQYGLVGVKLDGGTKFIVMVSAKSGSPDGGAKDSTDSEDGLSEGGV